MIMKATQTRTLIETVLSSSLTSVKPAPADVRNGGNVARAKAVRDTFRALGWAKAFRVRKGGYSLGIDIDLTSAAQPAAWVCAEAKAAHDRDYNAGMNCPCVTCKTLKAQRVALSRRVHFVLQVLFADAGREFGDRSETQSDYFDADYTFYP